MTTEKQFAAQALLSDPIAAHTSISTLIHENATNANTKMQRTRGDGLEAGQREEAAAVEAALGCRAELSYIALLQTKQM